MPQCAAILGEGISAATTAGGHVNKKEVLLTAVFFYLAQAGFAALWQTCWNFAPRSRSSASEHKDSMAGKVSDQMELRGRVSTQILRELMGTWGGGIFLLGAAQFAGGLAVAFTRSDAHQRSMLAVGSAVPLTVICFLLMLVNLAEVVNRLVDATAAGRGRQGIVEQPYQWMIEVLSV